MPIFVALMASAVLHVSMLLSEGWALPNMSEVEELDVVLAPPPARKLPEAPPAPVVKAPSAPVKPRNEPAPPLLAPADIAASSAAPSPVALAGTETPEDAALAAPTQADAPALAPSAQALASSASPTPAPGALAGTGAIVAAPVPRRSEFGAAAGGQCPWVVARRRSPKRRPWRRLRPGWCFTATTQPFR